MLLASSQPVSLAFSRRLWVPCALALLSLLAGPAPVSAQTDPGPVDLSHRASARAWHNRWWPKTYGADMGFTGDVSKGLAGDVSPAWRDQCLLRINLLRRMAGCQPLVFKDAYNRIDQQAAMMMSANNQLSHYPDTNWLYWNEDGWNAAQRSSLALGLCGPGAVLGYLFDPGPLNTGTGHRLQMLMPALNAAGWGDVPANTATGNYAANAFYMNDPSFAGSLNYDRPLVGWPAPGYVPNYLITGRWSLGLPDADTTGVLTVADAKLTVTRDGVPVTSLYYGAATNGTVIMWTMDGTSEGDTSYIPYLVNGEHIEASSPTNGVKDVVYHVKLTGVRYRVTNDTSNVGEHGVDLGGGAPYNGDGVIEYDVIAYDPDTPDLTISTQPVTQQVSLGGSAVLFVQASHALAYQWLHAGKPITGATSASLVLSQIQSADLGDYAVSIKGVAGDSLVSDTAVLSLSAGTNALVNMSTRAVVGTGDKVLIAGLVINGDQPKTVLLRGAGPALTALGVTEVLKDPQLTLYDSSGTVLASNDDWGSEANQRALISTVATQVGAFAWPADSKDSALLVTLKPGLYTVIESGVGGSTGVGLVEAYAVGETGTTRLYNLSSRSLTQGGDKVTIAGFVVSGTQAKTVLLRCSGPSLAKLGVSGVMADPLLLVYQGSTLLASNDDWSTDAGKASSISSAAKKVGAFDWSSGTKDAALLLTLQPGLYTAMGQGKDESSGVTLLEVYEVE